MDYLKKYFKDYVILTAGVFIMAVAINLFLASHSLVFGGVSGLAIILVNTVYLPIWVTNIIVNIPLLIFGKKYMGNAFLVKTYYCVFLLSAFLKITSGLTHVPSDLIVASVFGGICLGIGVAITVKAGGSTGGTDSAAMILRDVLKIPLNISILMVDSAIVLLGLVFFGINNALYALIVVFFISTSVKMMSDKLDKWAFFKY